jgi:hypothetical protein
MTIFFRLLSDQDKGTNLKACCAALRANIDDSRILLVAPESFRIVPGAPFAYWVSVAVKSLFSRLDQFEKDGRFVKHGLTTGDDYRFLRTWWETSGKYWLPFAKGGSFSPYYYDQKLLLNWRSSGNELRCEYATKTIPGTRLDGCEYFGKPGLTWALRARRFAPQALARGGSFSARGYCAFFPGDTELQSLSLSNSSAFDYIYKIALGRFSFPEFIVGILQIIPWPKISSDIATRLSFLGRRAWSRKRSLDTVDETSHAFVLPTALRNRVAGYDPETTGESLQRIQVEIDAIAFSLYGFSESDRSAVHASSGAAAAQGEEDYQASGDDDENEDEEAEGSSAIDQTTGLLSWSAGVAFGRFDWRLATGERAAPPEPDPFDPLPAKSPGMLPDGAEPFHPHAGILVDDLDHKHDLARLIEEVLTRVDAPVPADVRRWLQREFFPFHLQRYSKSRRKAPIYWPLATASGSYTLWLYYPDLTSQTLYTAVNEFIEPKLEQLGKQATVLRNKGSARSRDDDRVLEALQTLEKELIELRDTILQIAPTYRPIHDDGVQITAAPLWKLFRHKPWQKLVKETWAKLEKGDYDWAHLAMAYRPDQVREKCKTDKSLAIAHDLEHLYVEPEAAPAKARGRRKGTDA